MNYKRLKKELEKYKSLHFTQKEMRAFYEELYWTSIMELKFSRLQTEHYKTLLNEVEVLLGEEVKNNLILKVIELWKKRWDLDISIHYDLIDKKYE